MVKEHLTDDFLKNFLDGEIKHLIIYSQTPNLVLDELKKKLKFIKAAGGIVINELDELLIIFRLGKYDLPKGKCEPRETTEQSAVREVEEECGINNLIINGSSESTFHIYKLKDQFILKQTFWYNMHTKKQTLTPQKEEDITNAQWINKSQMKTIIENTYPTLIDLLKKHSKE